MLHQLGTQDDPYFLAGFLWAGSSITLRVVCWSVRVAGYIPWAIEAVFAVVGWGICRTTRCIGQGLIGAYNVVQLELCFVVILCGG